MADSSGLRLNKALADAGVCSRRAADELVFSGRVTVDGKRADSPGLRVDPLRHRVAVDGRPVTLRRPEQAACWLMLHKPVEVVSTARDPEGRRTVLDLVPEPWRKKRLYPVGRLDFFSEGLLLLTDDGELANRLTHPRWHLPRGYEVRVRIEQGGVGRLEDALAVMRQGMTLAEGERLAPVEARLLPEQSRPGTGRAGDGGPLGGRRERDAGTATLEMILHQGVNRQIRRMCRDLGLTVLRLRRVRQGPLTLGDLPLGAVRPLSGQEVAGLRRAVGLVGNHQERKAS